MHSQAGSNGQVSGFMSQVKWFVLIPIAFVLLLLVSNMLISAQVEQFREQTGEIQTEQGKAALQIEADNLESRLLRQNLIVVLAAGAGFTLLTLGLLFFVFIRPLAALNTGVEKMASGQLDVSLPPASGELGRLARNLGQTRQSLIELQNCLGERDGELDAVQQQLQQAVDERAHVLMTLEQAKERANAAERTKRAFVSRMDHELRTPLNAIIGYSELLQDQAEDLYNTLKTDLEKIGQSGSQLLTQISQVLDLSGIETGEIEACVESFDLQALLEEMVTEVRPLLDKNQNTLELIQRDDLPTLLCGDADKLRQVLFGLLSNATKFTKAGQIMLTVERETDEQAEWVVFQVADTGIGIASDKVDELFKAFAQADTSMTRQYDGTGLGLTIAKHFCELMDGSIAVQSELGQGSVFSVHLPYLLAEESQQPEILSELPAPPSPVSDAGPPTKVTVVADDPSRIHSGRAKPAEPTSTPPPIQDEAKDAEGLVLVIGKDPLARQGITQSLAETGLEAMTAASSEEGMLWMRMQRPKLVTLDVLMPDVDGWQALQTLKSDPDLADIPVFMLALGQDQQTGLVLGVGEYLAGDVDFERLMSVVGRYLPADQNNARALLVEGREDIRQMLHGFLEERGWAVSDVDDGLQALAYLETDRPTVIVLDLMVPELESLQFLTELRHNPAWWSIPVVVFVAKAFTLASRQRLNDHIKQILEQDLDRFQNLSVQINALITAHVRN